MASTAVKTGTAQRAAGQRAAGQRVAGQFRVATIGEGNCTLESFNRRDFYKISLITQGSPCILRYGALDEMVCDRPALVLLNPMVPYAWAVPESGGGTGGSAAGVSGLMGSTGGSAVEAGGVFLCVQSCVCPIQSVIVECDGAFVHAVRITDLFS